MECNDLFDWTKDGWILSLESYGFINIMVFNSEVASNTPLFSSPLIDGIVFYPSYSQPINLANTNIKTKAQTK